MPWTTLSFKALAALSLLATQLATVSCTPVNLAVKAPDVHDNSTMHINSTPLLSKRQASTSKPFWAIAHRVLVKAGIKAALSHGANALEIDMQPWKDQWWADHDGTLTSAGDTAEQMFQAVAAERKAGANVGFVWLDIKNPDWCDAKNPACNIEALQSKARAILEPAGVKVLYGFYNDKGRAYQVIRDSLNANEAINQDGKAKEVQASFEKGGPKDIAKRVLSKGLFTPRLVFGNCKDDGWMCSQLRQGVESKAFGKVFGWTFSNRQAGMMGDLVEKAHVDGLIFGNAASHYTDAANLKKLATTLEALIKNVPDKARMATLEDKPW
ncbi:hypothetical protein CDD81_966 [Ophiocordyceps australis]|uniref:Phospholipase D n=1 Tax=Ophiocordyceps australis TaxID=1399860 RepID=A0A2C5Y0T1_9HYPO|nr:hypothetical protein CDD81_966 [Ophiocordyceps australis]